MINERRTECLSLLSTINPQHLSHLTRHNIIPLFSRAPGSNSLSPICLPQIYIYIRRVPIYSPLRSNFYSARSLSRRPCNKSREAIYSRTRFISLSLSHDWQKNVDNEELCRLQYTVVFSFFFRFRGVVTRNFYYPTGYESLSPRAPCARDSCMYIYIRARECVYIGANKCV